jgi:hypothetical protein
VRKGARAWRGICLATVEHLFFWRLVDEIDQKSATIAGALAETIRYLQNSGFRVCSIVANNASNEFTASNPAIATFASVERESLSSGYLA